jgi:hypothetical protein
MLHVGNHPANHFALYMNVFPRTLLLPHVTTWDTVLLDHPLAVQDLASFQPDIAQEAMEDLLRKFKEVDVYINDIGIFSNTWSDHITSLAKILALLDHSLPRLKFGSKSNKFSVALNLVSGGFSQFLPNLYHKF